MKQLSYKECCEALIGTMDLESLNKIVERFPYLLSEALREINGEVEYKMVEKSDKRR